MDKVKIRPASWILNPEKITRELLVENILTFIALHGVDGARDGNDYMNNNDPLLRLLYASFANHYEFARPAPDKREFYLTPRALELLKEYQNETE